MGNPFAIEIFYPDGDPENMRVVNKLGWTGTVFYINREYWAAAKAEYGNELKSPGIYLLTGREERFENNDDLQTIYIGHTRNLVTRIDQHSQEPTNDFFQSVVCVTGGRGFNTGHYEWMEGYLINLAKEIERCDLNIVAQPRIIQVSKSQVVAMERFLEEMLQIFRVVDINAFTAPKTVSPPTGDKNRRLGKEKVSELRKKILDTFQEKESVELLKRSQATFYDESKTTHVCCTISKNHADDKNGNYWFTPSKNWIDFLQGGEEGYLIFGMEDQSKMVVISINEFKKIKDKFNTNRTEEGEINWWYVAITENSGLFQFKFKKGKGTLDLSPYLFDID